MTSLHLEQVRAWFGRPLWDMEPADADAYFGKVLRGAAKGTRLARAQALTTFFAFLELRHKVEIHAMTGRVVACPIDEMNRPRGRKQAALRIPPTEDEVNVLFAGWREELATCRKFGPTARNYAAARLMSEVGLRVNEARNLDLADIKWELGRFGKLHVRIGKGARGSGPRERMVPLISDAGRDLRWFVEDVWGQFDDDHSRPGVPLFPSERKNTDGTCRRVGDDALRAGAGRGRRGASAGLVGHPHSARFAALLRQPALSVRHGPDLDPGTLGHSWIATTMNYVHVHRTRIEDAWVAGQQRAAQRLEGLLTHEMEPAPGRGQPRHLEGQRPPAHARRTRAGDQRREDVGAVVGQSRQHQTRDLDVICAVLGCPVGELLIPEPEKVRSLASGRRSPTASGTAGPPVTPRRRDGRSLPPE